LPRCGDEWRTAVNLSRKADSEVDGGCAGELVGAFEFGNVKLLALLGHVLQISSIVVENISILPALALLVGVGARLRVGMRCRPRGTQASVARDCAVALEIVQLLARSASVIVHEHSVLLARCGTRQRKGGDVCDGRGGEEAVGVCALLVVDVEVNRRGELAVCEHHSKNPCNPSHGDCGKRASAVETVEYVARTVRCAKQWWSTRICRSPPAYMACDSDNWQ
jgi:hypothetical protein